MKFFSDGADPKEIRTCVEQGLIDGVTTNPTLISKVLGAGSAARDPQALLKLCIDINRLENEADAILRRSVARLFKEEKDPIFIIKWKEIYENLENATDRCEDVANIIEGVILENS